MAAAVVTERLRRRCCVCKAVWDEGTPGARTSDGLCEPCYQQQIQDYRLGRGECAFCGKPAASGDCGGCRPTPAQAAYAIKRRLS